MKSLFLSSFLFCIFSLLHAQQPGTLDPSFGNKGTLIDTINNESLHQALTIQKDGKIVVGGIGVYKGFQTFKVDRLLPDGSTDLSFGINGSAYALFPGFVDSNTDGGSISAITLLPDGKILAAGNIGDIGLARFNPDGTLDSSFGLNGVSEVYSDGFVFVKAIALQPDGKILIGGTDLVDVIKGSYRFYTVRCLPNGNTDKSYGNGGTVLGVSAGGGANAIAVQPDGKIVAAGYSGNPAFNADFRIERYNEDGTYDNSFGTDGVVDSHIGSNAVCLINDLALQADGKMVAAGRSNGLFDIEFTVVRYNADGSFDNSFGNGGVVITTFQQNDGEAKKVLLTGENEDKIVVAGSDYATDGDDFAAVGYNSDGSLDPSFGNQGIQTTDFGSADVDNTAALEPDGKIVLAGYTVTGGANPFYDGALARYYGYPVKVSLAVRIKRWLQNHTLSWNGLPAEDKIAYYSVEQSSNSRSGFTQIAKVSGRSNLPDYSITNSRLLQGMNYYRVKAVSTDGVVRYSEIVSADNTANTASVYPNPAKDYVLVKGLPVNTTASISIADGSGNVRVRGVSNGSEQYRSQLTNMQPGTYYVNITTATKTEVLKLVKE